MAVDTNIQVLDLLFDDQDGVLTKEVDQVPPLDFSNLDLFSGDLLECALTEANINDYDFLNSPGLPHKTKDIYSDHDYFAQKSPSNSDSGVSMSSSGNPYSPQSVSSDPQHSPRYTDQQCSPDPGNLSESPRSPSNLVPDQHDLMDVTAEYSPSSQNEQINLDDFDMKDINLEGIDTSALITDEEFLKQICGSTLNQDTSINFGTDTSLDEVTSTTAVSDTSQVIRVIKMPASSTDTLPFTMKDISTSTSSSKIPELKLTEEEQDLLAKEGVSLPTDMPLTKEEERILKAVRRKIRNKISAKESRKRKMTYVEGLEKRVKMCTSENAQLKKKCDGLEQQNQTLMQQLKKLQGFIVSKTTTKPQTSTCVMVLLLSFAFIIVPNFNPFKSFDSLSDVRKIPIPGNSRSLLHNGDMDISENDDNPYGLTIKPGPPFEVPPKTPAVPIPPNIKIDTIIDEDILYNSLSSEGNKTDIHVQLSEESQDINSNQDVKIEPNVQRVDSGESRHKGHVKNGDL